MSRIYIVEDDGDIREIVLYALRSAGFDGVGFEDGNGFFAALKTSIPSLVLLDVMLPGNDGLNILKQLRGAPATSKLPVIMLTAKSSEFDKVKGLDMGADDYIAKPFGVMELLSRVNAVLRRSEPSPAQEKAFEFGDVILDNARHTVLVRGTPLSLTHKEYSLLHYLILNAGLVLSREKIMEAVWGYDFEGESRTLDMHIHTLRQKLGESGKLIKTIRNVGYKFDENQRFP